jgi:rhodanese-related sulfurtransferase
VALQLKKLGIARVRPLAGGIERWRDLNYPVEPSVNSASVAVATAEEK